SFYNFDIDEYELEMPLMVTKSSLKKESRKTKIKYIITHHRAEDGKSYPLHFGDESQGTQKLFNMAGYVLDALENGHVLVVDELSSSLHPHALQGVIRLFQNKKTNPKGAQLIFT